MNKALIIFFYFFFCSPQIQSQTAILKGLVQDTAGRGIQGLSVLIKEKNIEAKTDLTGRFEMVVPASKTITLIVRAALFLKYETKLFLTDKSTKEVKITLLPARSELTGAVIKGNAKDNQRTQASSYEIDLKEEMVNASGSLEAVLKFIPGVGGNNELSSGYSVRGGNYDENLVYVNDFEVYRPYLMRSGQQEGLSFANPDLVKSIKFSTGGFQPRYGDKMSSVLDITYKKPSKMAASAELSLLGGSMHLEGASKNRHLTFLGGLRQRSAQYLLGSLDTKGQYLPSFTDVQAYITYSPSDKLSFESLTNYAYNRYYLEPEKRTTRFGLVNYTLDFTVDYRGSENDKYQSFMTGFATTYKPDDHLILKGMVSHYRTQENEQFDILGNFFIGEVETDVTKPNFNEVKSLLGIGSIHNFARNQLSTEIWNAGFIASLIYNKHNIRMGCSWKFENIHDRLNQWEKNDSAGYSIPNTSGNLDLKTVFKSSNTIETERMEGYFQDAWRWDKDSAASFGITYGARYHLWNFNRELLISPRIQLYLIPSKKKNWVLTASTGLYQQAPFYRELRDRGGNINPEVKAQKSIHYILGSELLFPIEKRPFKFTTEVYYKHMWDINPYEYQNILIRYYAKNDAMAYATGIDLRLQGELVKDAESWIGLSIMQTKEIVNQTFYKYRDDTGAVFFSPNLTSRAITDTIAYQRGYIPRPTDQLVNFSLFFQDYIPKHPEFKVHLNLLFGSGLPFGPPNNDQFRNFFNLETYKRVDIGFSAQLYDLKRRKVKPELVSFKHLKSIWATLEVFNLLGIQNEVSKDWIKDYSNRVFAVPNYLTGRRLNLRVIVKF